MKTLIATNHSYMLYRFRKELIAELLKSGEVVLSMPFVGHEDDFEKMGCKCINTPVDRRGVNPITDARLLLCYLRLIKSERPDRVITYSIKPNIYCAVASRLKKIPYFINVQGLGTAFQKKPLAYAVTLMYKIAAKKAKRVIFENSANCKLFLDKNIIKKGKECVVNGAGVNTLEYPYSEPENNASIHFLYLGRIMKEKGIDELLAAYERLKGELSDKITLDMVGFFEDEYKDRINRLADEGLINFYGFQTDAKRFYENADCVVLPSYHEGMSNVLLEAGAVGRACITSDIPGCKEAVDDGVTGYLTEKQNADDLYEKMKAFASLSFDKRREMGLKAHEKMLGEFDKKMIVDKLIGVINEK